MRISQDNAIRALLAALFVAMLAASTLFARLDPRHVVEGTDAPQYHQIARNLAEDRGFTLAADPPYAATVYREPGYPLFVATLYGLFGPTPVAVVRLQTLFLVLAAGLTYLLAARLFGRLEGVGAAYLVGPSPELLHLANQLLSETFFLCLFLATLLLVLRARASAKTLDYAAVGLGLGLAALTRAIAAPLLLPVLLLLFVAGHGPRPRRLLGCAVLLLAFSLSVTPWIVRNAETTGQAVLTSRFGVNLVRRAPRAAEPLAAYPNWLRASAWIIANPLSNLVVPLDRDRFQWGSRPEENLIFDFHVNESVRYLQRYDPICRVAADWEQCATEIGMDFVRRYPLQYTLQSGFELVKLHFTPIPGIHALVHNATIWCAFSTLLVLVVRRRLRKPHVVLLGIVAAYLGGSVVVDTQVRYLVPVYPLYAAFAAAGFVAVGRAIAATVTGTRARSSLRAEAPR